MRRVFAVACAVLMMAAVLPAAADGAVKEEVVYGLLSAEGGQENVYVVNAFELSAAGEVTDYGAYDSLLNLTNEAPLTAEGDTVHFTADKGRFYYQGALNAAVLPWAIEIAYTLDGVPATPQELSGKSGQIAISISIHPTDSVFAKAYALQTTVTLDGGKCLGISAPGGVIAASGRNRVIAFTLLPGQEASYTVTAAAEDFSMESISFAGMTISLQVSMNLSALTGRVDELKSGTASLAGGAQGVEAGAAQLSDSLAQLKTGLAAIQDSMAKLQDGVSAMAAQPAFAQVGTSLSSGIQSIKTGLDTWATGFSAVADGAASLKDGATELSNGASELNGSVSQMDVDAMAKEASESLFPELPEGLSFVSPEKGKADSVQFVLLAKGVDAPVTVEEEAAPVEEESFWDRLVSLFTGK